jgi:putative hydrolase of the HAD superfamily
LYKINSVIFDLGKVLLDFDFTIAIRRLQKLQPVDLAKVQNLFCNSSLAKNWDKGLLSSDNFFAVIQKELNLVLPLEKFKIIWNEIFSEKTEMVEFAKNLHKHKKIAILSNTNPWHAAYVRQHHPWIDEFDHFVASCDVKMLKPDAEIYRLVLKELGASPSETLYIDDLESNVQGAVKAGIQGLVFKGLFQLGKDLKLLGIEGW